MKKLRITKYGFAIILIVCFFLPLSKCSKHIVEADPDKEGEFKVVGTEYSYLIPLKEIKVNDPYSFFVILPFFWPIPLWLIQRKLKKNLVVVIFKSVELLLLCFSTYFIVLWSVFLGETYIGGYLALLSLLIIWLIVLIPVIKSSIEYIKKKRKFNNFLQRIGKAAR